MRGTLGTVLTIVGIFAACGGHVEGEGEVRPCNLGTSCSGNAMCTLVSACGDTETCTCSNGSWLCPTSCATPTPKPPPPKPPGDGCEQDAVLSGACLHEGQTCPSFAIACGAHPFCTCTGGSWNCPDTCGGIDAGGVD